MYHQPSGRLLSSPKWVISKHGRDWYVHPAIQAAKNHENITSEHVGTFANAVKKLSDQGVW
jgi:hypothetical protein